jgi:hypothetical protein
MTPIIDPMAAIIIRTAPSSEAYSALPWSPVVEEPATRAQHLVRVRRSAATALQAVAGWVEPREQSCTTCVTA